MTASRPTFRIMKNGYDRFAVDDAIERYASQVDQLEHRIQLYQQQLVETTRQMDELRAKYIALQQQDEARAQAAESIARLSLREANDIIDTAQRNADDIVNEALQSARVILLDLSKLYEQAETVKVGMYSQLEALMGQIDKFQMPSMPDLGWLNDTEKKMR